MGGDAVRLEDVVADGDRGGGLDDDGGVAADALELEVEVVGLVVEALDEGVHLADVDDGLGARGAFPDA